VIISTPIIIIIIGRCVLLRKRDCLHIDLAGCWFKSYWCGYITTRLFLKPLTERMYLLWVILTTFSLSLCDFIPYLQIAHRYTWLHTKATWRYWKSWAERALAWKRPTRTATHLSTWQPLKAISTSCFCSFPWRFPRSRRTGEGRPPRMCWRNPPRQKTPTWKYSEASPRYLHERQQRPVDKAWLIELWFSWRGLRHFPWFFPEQGNPK